MDENLPRQNESRRAQLSLFGRGKSTAELPAPKAAPSTSVGLSTLYWSHCKNLQMYGLFTTSACSWDRPKCTQDTLSGYPWSPGSLILHSIQHLDLISLLYGPGVSEDKENYIHCYRHHGKSMSGCSITYVFSPQSTACGWKHGESQRGSHGVGLERGNGG